MTTYTELVEKIEDGPSPIEFAETTFNDYAGLVYPQYHGRAEDQTFGKLLKILLDSLPKDEKTLFAEIAYRWTAFVGEINNQRCKPVKLEKHTLEVVTIHNQYVKSLQLVKGPILTKIQEFAGPTNVVDIKFYPPKPSTRPFY
jgi:hypothetical protein